jgi:hypothetical protein
VTGTIAQWLRKAYPNVAQYFYKSELHSGDFNDAQKKVMARVIKAAIARTGKVEQGSTKYEDYGGYVADEFKNHPEGPGQTDMILRTTTRNTSFTVATTLGRFKYFKNSDGSYTVSDKWDFSKAKHKTVTLDELEGKTFIEQVAYVTEKDHCTEYQAIRHIGYLQSPDTEKGALTLTVKIPAEMMGGTSTKKDAETPVKKDTEKEKKGSTADTETDKSGSDSQPAEEPKKQKQDTKQDATPGASPSPDKNKKTGSDKPPVNNDKEEKPKSTTVIKPSTNRRPDDKKGDSTTVVSPYNKSHTLKPVITLRNGKPHFKMKNGKPLVKLREILKELITDILSES